MNDEMKPIRLSLPGDWADAWLYKDNLLVWSMSGRLHQISLDRVVNRLRRDYGEEVALATNMLLFRNDWKSGLQTDSFRRAPGVANALDEALRQATDLVTLTVGLDDLQELDREPVPGRILSTSIYANHAFVASTAGTFETNVNPRNFELEGDLIQRLTFASHHVVTNFGAVAVSGFEEGLWFDTIDMAEGSSWLSGSPMQRVADYSRSAETASRDLLNYTDERIPDLFLADAERGYQSQRSRYESWQVKGYRRSEDTLSALTARGLGVAEADPVLREIEVLGNANQRLLVDNNGHLEILLLRTLSDVKLERTKVSLGSMGRQERDDIFSTSPMANGFVLETANHLRWLSEDGVVDLLEGEVANVRTFPGSRHFQGMAIAILQDSLELIGLARVPAKQ